jgi:hypothetical protein
MLLAKSGADIHQRKPSAHQKQIWFFTVLFTIFAGCLVLGLLLLINRSH